MRRVGCAARIKVYRPAYKYTLNDSLNGNKSESCTCGTEKYLPNNSCSGYDFLGWKGTDGVTYSAGTKLFFAITGLSQHSGRHNPITLPLTHKEVLSHPV